MFVLLAIVIGLIINFYTGGFEFSPALCFMAGIFLIMPSLLDFKFSDFKSIKNYKFYVFLSILFNFIILPLIFVGIGYLIFGFSEVLFALLFLSLLPGGGMLFSWINKNNGDKKVGFNLFFINLIIFGLLFIPLNIFLTQYEGVFNNSGKDTGALSYLGIENTVARESVTCPFSALTGGAFDCMGIDISFYPIAFFMVLVVIPFLLSRIIIESKFLYNIIKPRISIIGKIASFLLVMYIFTLEEVNVIFNSDVFLIFKILLSLFLSYFLVFTILYLIGYMKGFSGEFVSVIYNSSIRFITMGIVFSFIYNEIFGINFVLTFALAYLIQISLSIVFSYIIKKSS